MATRTSVFATNDIITANDLNSLAGGWNAYTPALGNFTAGNGVATGKYLQFGKLVIFRAEFVFGTTSAAATAMPSLSLPVTADITVGPTIVGSFYDKSALNHYTASVSLTTSTAVLIGVLGTSGLRSNASTTSPFTWASTDIIRCSGIYEAA